MTLVHPLDDLDGGGALLSVAKYPTTPLLSVALKFSPTLDEVDQDSFKKTAAFGRFRTLG